MNDCWLAWILLHNCCQLMIQVLEICENLIEATESQLKAVSRATKKRWISCRWESKSRKTVAINSYWIPTTLRRVFWRAVLMASASSCSIKLAKQSWELLRSSSATQSKRCSFRRKLTLSAFCRRLNIWKSWVFSLIHRRWLNKCVSSLRYVTPHTNDLEVLHLLFC